MKNVKNFTLSLLFLFAPLTALVAQSNVAHINTQELISEMPEVIAAQKELKKLEDQFTTEMETSVKEFQTKAQTYRGDAENQTDIINQQRQVELQDMQQRIQNYTIGINPNNAQKKISFLILNHITKSFLQK